MNEDNWKLKTVIITKAGNGHIEGTDKQFYLQIDEDNEYGLYYRKIDIEILRQKLIEDLINYNGFLSQKGDGDSTLECPKSEIIDLINKRFGIEK